MSKITSVFTKITFYVIPYFLWYLPCICLCIYLFQCVYALMCVHLVTCTCYLICVPDAVFTFFSIINFIYTT